MAEPRTGLLRQMRSKLAVGSLEELTATGQPGGEQLPLGPPPDTLETLLVSDTWFPAFLAFLRESYQVVEDEEQAEPSIKLLRECEKMFSDGVVVPVTRAERRARLRGVREGCRPGLDQLVRDFTKHVSAAREQQ